jgi:hypothetical protein
MFYRLTIQEADILGRCARFVIHACTRSKTLWLKFKLVTMESSAGDY